MSLYQCEDCGCIENTALGYYHSRFSENLYDKKYIGKQLCSACGPPEFKSGRKSDFGKWHGEFKRRFFEKDSLFTDSEGNIKKKVDNDYPSSGDEIGETNE